MELSIMNTILTVVGLVLVNFSVKLGRAYPLLKKVYTLMKTREEAKKDGVLTQKEKAQLFDEINIVLIEAWSIIKSWLPDKSK